MAELDIETPDRDVTESRRDRKKRETTERIVSAARRLFSQHGFEQTTVELIAETADVSKPTLFNYFPSKLALLQALVPETDAWFAAALDEARLEQTTMPAQLEHFFVFAVGMIHKSPLLTQAMLVEALRAYTEPGATPERHRFAQMHEALVTLVEGGVERGEVRTDLSAEQLANYISGLYVHELLRWLVDSTYPIAEEVRAAARFLGSALAPSRSEKSPQ